MDYPKEFSGARRNLMLDAITPSGYALPTAAHSAGGFDSSYNVGARAMRRQAHGFFYASRFMVGGIWEAARLAGPTSGLSTQISPTARRMTATVGGLNHLRRSHP